MAVALVAGPVPIVQMFGVTESGNSVMCHVHGFAPYFYCPAPTGFKESMCDQFRRQLDTEVLANLYSSMKDVKTAVLHVEMCMKESIYKWAPPPFHLLPLPTRRTGRPRQ